MAEPTVPPDPIRTKSLSGPIAISSLLLILTSAWAVWDEGVHKRPYIGYQGRWIEEFGKYLNKLEPEYAQAEKAAVESPLVQALQQKAQAVREAQAAQIAAVTNELNAIHPKLKAMDFQFRDRKGRTDQYINRIENAHESDKEKLRKELADYRKETFEIELAEGKKKYTGPELIQEYLDLKVQQGLLQAKLGQLSAPIQAADKEKDAQIAKLTRGASTAKVRSLKNELDNFKKEIKQIHVPEMRDLVDRCESCHLGIRSTIPIKAEDVGGEKAFTSHPNPELLAIHDPEKFGCSPCHNGNGVAVISEEIAHGHYHHWLWPQPARENIEAGCVQCHVADLVVDHAPVLNAGKETFRFRGCWACHRYDGFESEADQLVKVQKDLRDMALKGEALKTRAVDANDAKIAVLGVAPSGDVYSLAGLDAAKRQLALEVASKTGIFSADKRAALSKALKDDRLTEADRDAVAEALTAEAPAISQSLAAVDTSRATAQRAEREVLLEVKKVGPSLKEVRMKLKPEWLLAWIADPAKFRPTTKMPTYAQLTQDPKQVEAIAAFIWSRGVQGPLAKNDTGDASRGGKLVRDRGCLGCHSAKQGDDVVGNTFAAELTRVGEKANFDYLVRWVSNPKQKTLPYSYGLKRDLTPDDFKNANVPFEFEHTNPNWPKDWGTLLTHQMTVMPNLRLSPADARDIASYLVAQRGEGITYGDAAMVTNASAEAIKTGEKLVKHYGCAACHEIAGLEDFQKIGTELSKEGSKPIERLDFGHLTHEAKLSGHGAGGWYTQKGFFDRKLANPQTWDVGKELAATGTRSEWTAPEFTEGALRMPNFRLKPEDVTAVSTFLIGSVESGIPPAFMHYPQDQRKAIQEGWWVVKKYNCIGCHAVTPGEKPVLWTIPWFEAEGLNLPKWADAQGVEHRGGSDRRPPTLVGEGARVDPQWVSEFLRNPALSKTNVHRNGLRPYLDVRMPTFDLSEGEIGKLVRFFGALSSQPMPYLKPEQVPLNAEEAAAGRAILAQVCAKCHATGDTVKFTADVNAPDFRYAQYRLKPQWMTRLIQVPGSMLPGTNMPPWFIEKDGRWVFKEPWPPGIPEHKGDHIELMVRFLSQYNDPGIGKQ